MSQATKSMQNRFRIETKGCKITDLPLYDIETRRLFKNILETIWECNHKPVVNVKRFNETSIDLSWTEVMAYKPICYYRKLSRGIDDFHFIYGQFKHLCY